ncbi:MAG TPA: hypothetical protein VED87_09140, partial [Methylocystis sp.]|nr:hypothetical protein [Methylocystis sp.]
MRAAPEDRPHADLIAKRDAPIVAQALSEAKRERSYEDLWGEQRRFVEPAAKEDRQSRAPVITAVIATLLSAMALIALREKIVVVAPPTATAFKAVGLPVNIVGLDLRKLSSRIVMDGARKVLAIEGEIANLRRQPTHVPQLALTVRGDDGQAKYAWSSPAPKTQLQPGETVPF